MTHVDFSDGPALGCVCLCVCVDTSHLNTLSNVGCVHKDKDDSNAHSEHPD